MNQGFPFDCTQHGLRCHNKMCIDVTIFPSDRNFVILSWDIHEDLASQDKPYCKCRACIQHCILQIHLRYSSCSIVHAVFYRKVHWLKGLRKGVWPSCSDFAVENNTLIRRLNKYIEAFAANILKLNIPWYHRHLIFQGKVLCMSCIVGYLQYSSQFMQWLR